MPLFGPAPIRKEPATGPSKTERWDAGRPHFRSRSCLHPAGEFLLLLRFYITMGNTGTTQVGSTDHRFAIDQTIPSASFYYDTELNW